MAQQNPFGHPVGCNCESCQDWRDVQLGLATLAGLKEVQDGSTVGTASKRCPDGHPVISKDHNFCTECGKKLVV